MKRNTGPDKELRTLDAVSANPSIVSVSPPFGDPVYQNGVKVGQRSIQAPGMGI